MTATRAASLHLGGDVMSLRIQDPKKLEGIKVGDTVDVTYTQALMLSVDPVK